MASVELEDLRLRSRVEQNPCPNVCLVAEREQSGVKAWLKVLGCFIIFINTYGMASSFGVYQAYYESTALPHHSPSTISWIGTAQVFFLGFTGIVAGPLYDRGYVQSVLAVGCSLVVVGLFMLSLSTEYYQILLSQGVCIGIGEVPSTS